MRLILQTIQLSHASLGRLRVDLAVQMVAHWACGLGNFACGRH